MLAGHLDWPSESHSSSPKRRLLFHGSGLDNNGDAAAYSYEHILYAASFEELASKIIHYEMVLWFSISLLLVLAWGVGIIMLLYLPFRIYVLKKDISNRKLYVTSTEIVYKVSRPSHFPFCSMVNIENRIPLNMVIDIIIEQGWLQSLYGLETFRVESVARGKAAHIDEWHAHGIANPGLLRKVIVREAVKVMEGDAGRNWEHTGVTGEGAIVPSMTSFTEGPSFSRSPTRSWKVTSTPHHVRSVSGELVWHKLDEVRRSVKRIELLIEKSQSSAEEI